MTAAVEAIRKSGVMVLPLDSLRRDGGTQPRGHINHEVAQRYADLMKDGREFPPLTAFFDGQSYWLADGFHRGTAYRVCGITDVPVEVRSGSLRDAQWFSFSVNADHGYPRNDTDLAKIMARVFTDEEWCDMPVRAIADHVGISATSAFYYRDRYLYGAQRRSPSPTVFTCEQSCPSAAEVQPRETPAPDEQYDIEDAIAEAKRPKLEGNAPSYGLRSFPPEHAGPASRIRELVGQLYREMNLSPADAARAAPGDPNVYRRQAGAVWHWLSRLEEELKL